MSKKDKKRDKIKRAKRLKKNEKLRQRKIIEGLMKDLSDEVRDKSLTIEGGMSFEGLMYSIDAWMGEHILAEPKRKKQFIEAANTYRQGVMIEIQKAQWAQAKEERRKKEGQAENDVESPPRPENEDSTEE